VRGHLILAPAPPSTQVTVFSDLSWKPFTT
jgi:hypothetical protein